MDTAIDVDLLSGLVPFLTNTDFAIFQQAVITTPTWLGFTTRRYTKMPEYWKLRVSRCLECVIPEPITTIHWQELYQKLSSEVTLDDDIMEEEDNDKHIQEVAKFSHQHNLPLFEWWISQQPPSSLSKISGAISHLISWKVPNLYYIKLLCNLRPLSVDTLLTFLLKSTIGTNQSELFLYFLRELEALAVITPARQGRVPVADRLLSIAIGANLEGYIAYRTSHLPQPELSTILGWILSKGTVEQLQYEQDCQRVHCRLTHRSPDECVRCLSTPQALIDTVYKYQVTSRAIFEPAEVSMDPRQRYPVLVYAISQLPDVDAVLDEITIIKMDDDDEETVGYMSDKILHCCIADPRLSAKSLTTAFKSSMGAIAASRDIFDLFYYHPSFDRELVKLPQLVECKFVHDLLEQNLINPVSQDIQKYLIACASTPEVTKLLLQRCPELVTNDTLLWGLIAEWKLGTVLIVLQHRDALEDTTTLRKTIRGVLELQEYEYMAKVLEREELMAYLR
jgi:hypothetical protein